MKRKICYNMSILVLLLVVFSVCKEVSAQTQVKKYSYREYNVTYTIQSEWDNYYIARVEIENTGKKAINNFALSFSMSDTIEEIWGADIYSYKDGIYTINNEVYEQSIPIGTKQTISFRGKKQDINASIPENFKLVSTYMLLDEESYEIVIDSENDYQTKVTIHNISDNAIMGWNVKFDTSMKKITSDIGEITKQYGYNTFIQNKDIAIKPGESYSFHVYGNKVDDQIRLSDFSIYSSRILDIEKYSNVLFTSHIDSEATENFMLKEKNHVEVNEGEYVTIDINADRKKCLSEKVEYSGVASFIHNNAIINVDIEGELDILTEGVFGYLYGEYEGRVIAVTINDSFANSEPYVMISFGELESGDDYYKVYGKRMQENDILSDLVTEKEENNDSGMEVVPVEELDVSDGEKVIIKKKAKANKDYETLARAVQYSVFSYGGKKYYLGAISLYCPKKTHGNELYAARAKVNTHEGNAKYYFRKVIRMPGAITYFHHDANLNIYTGSKRVDFIKASPTTTSWFTSSLSISIPFGNFLSLSITNVSVPAGIKQKFSKIKGSTYDNKSKWNFNSQFSADIVNNNALTTKRGYAGYVQFVYSSKKTGNYHIYTKGVIHYEMKTRLSIYQYDSAFNVNVSTDCGVTNS